MQWQPKRQDNIINYVYSRRGEHRDLALVKISFAQAPTWNNNSFNIKYCFKIGVQRGILSVRSFFKDNGHFKNFIKLHLFDFDPTYGI